MSSDFIAIVGVVVGIVALFLAFDEVRSSVLRFFGVQSKIDRDQNVPVLKESLDSANALVDRFIAQGERLREKLRAAPPTSKGEFQDRSVEWHSWRRLTESYMWQMFSTTEVLRQLKERRPRHDESGEPWQDHATYLLGDVERELEFFRALRLRLPNYVASAKRRKWWERTKPGTADQHLH